MRTRSLQSLALVSTLVLARIASAGEPAGSVVYIDDDAPPGGSGQSWAQAFNSLQDAIATIPNLPAPVTLRVAQGVYRPDIGAGITPGDREKRFQILYPITLEGGYAGLTDADPDQRNTSLFTTLLCGDLLGNDGPDFTNRADNARTVVSTGYSFGSIRIDGVTVRGAEDPGVASGTYTGGIRSSAGGLVISDCIITDNRGSIGGGISFSGFSFGGSNDIIVENSWLHRNVATFCGGGIGKFGGSVTSGTTVVIRNSRLTMNTAPQGGAVFILGNLGNTIPVKVQHCIFDRNHAVYPNGFPFGGAMLITGSPTSEITNSTFSGNSAVSGLAGAVASIYSAPRVFNCIFAANSDLDGVSTDSQIYPALSNPPDSVNLFDTYSATSGQFGGGTWHAIVADPMFVDPVGPDGIPGTNDDDFRLRAGSPAIDAGVVLPSMPTYPVPLATDLDGLPRIIDDPTRPDSPLVPASTAPIDLGPYEYQSDCNGNMVIDSLDIANDPSIDCDSDGIIDTCQPFADCDANAINDRCEIAAGTAQDCNANGVPDACDIALGTSLDENDNGIPDECEPAVVRVAAPGSLLGTPDAWTDALDDLHDALALARSRSGPTEIWLAQGVYLPAPAGGDRLIAFEVSPGVSIYGGFSGAETEREQRDPEAFQSILSGDLNANDAPGIPEWGGASPPADRADNTLNVVRIRGSRSGIPSLLDGLTISGGFADGPRGGARPIAFFPTNGGTNREGGAIRIGFGASAEIIDCRLERNAANDGGALWTKGSAVELSQCELTSNRAANLGGAVCLLGFAPTGQPATIDRCRIASNHATVGGGLVSEVTTGISISNSLFTGNQSIEPGGGIFLSHATVPSTQHGIKVTGCTIVGNLTSAAVGGGVRAHPLNSLSITSTIIWGNTAATTDILEAQVNAIALGYTHNCIQGYQSGGGPGNIGLDPRFLDLNGHDGIPGTIDDNPALAARSPCIDAGANHAVPPGSTTDLLGSPRFIDDPNTIDTGAGDPPIVDIGAAEYVPPFLTCAGDANGDNQINAADLSVFLFMFGQSVAPGAAADFNADGAIDAADLALLLARFGDAC